MTNLKELKAFVDAAYDMQLVKDNEASKYFPEGFKDADSIIGHYAIYDLRNHTNPDWINAKE